ncbi:MAG: heat-inducible transcription repressor HrcA, partial [Clostridiales bacterium]|nr:heat-inducible transcription repressor HrcA [Clostridiales bacterium]
PVGSRYLSEHLKIGLSSATIRNEMAELEEMGYLCQPHTSAGRIPTDLGYRFYVDSLMQAYDFKASEVRALNDMLSERVAELDMILDKAGRFMSNMTNYTALAVHPKLGGATVYRYNAVFIDEYDFLLVVILGAGSVKTKYIHTDFPVDDGVLKRLERVLNSCMAGIDVEKVTLPTVMQMEREMGDASALIGPIVKYIYEIIGEQGSGALKLEGVDRLLEYPEFTDVNKLKGVLTLMEKQEDILDLIEDSGDGVKVLIGRENSVSVMNDSTLVFRTIKSKDRVIGAIGVIGPCRMDYAKVITTVETLCRQIENMVNGSELPSSNKEDRDDRGKE